MSQLTCIARRIGDYESRTEEYELVFSVGDAPARAIEVMYQAARAFEINAALDAATGTAREAISAADPDVRQPTDEALAKLAWRTLQSAKYDEGEARTGSLEF